MFSLVSSYADVARASSPSSSPLSSDDVDARVIGLRRAAPRPRLILASRRCDDASRRRAIVVVAVTVTVDIVVVVVVVAMGARE